MQCSSPCSTSAGWSSGHTLVIICEVLSTQASLLRSCYPHPSAGSRQQCYHGLPLILSHSVSRANSKAFCNSSDLAAATVFVTCAPTTSGPGSSHVPIEERTADDRIPGMVPHLDGPCQRAPERALNSARKPSRNFVMTGPRERVLVKFI